MKKFLRIIQELYHTVSLCRRLFVEEIQNIAQLILCSKGEVMIRSFFQAFEAMLRAIIYLLILIIGLAVTGLGTYMVLFLAFRIGQFFWELIFKEPWL